MNILLFKITLALSLGLFFIPKKIQYIYTLCLVISTILITSIWAVTVFTDVGSLNLPFISFLNHELYLKIDNLSAFFILVINFTCLTGIIYAKGYLKPYLSSKNKTEMAVHFFNYLWLHISMILVAVFRDALAFLIIWEVMSLSSFFLVAFESDKKETIKIGIKYLIQMHIGVVFLMFAFLWAHYKTGVALSFDGLGTYFSTQSPYIVFLLFFIGFGIKAGLVPLHSWLPHAHPAAPSHVSAVMSGVMIKMGIYGILRVLTYMHHDLFNIGLIILIVSLFSGLIGVSLAIMQHDVKKLLAYHSIENIGIIGIGIGLGVIGIAKNIPVLAVLGFGGGILHILNHSLFKSLLFYTAGSVYKQTHTRNIEQLGGLIKKMPKTALFFLLGALAISGLPPFNGFISEFLIYSGMFKSLQAADLGTDLVILFSFAGLALIGGLAVFCFTKVFSIIFLGTPRSEKVDHAKEVGISMILPDYLIGFMIIFIGLVPFIFINPLSKIVSVFTGNTSALIQIIPTLNSIGISSGIFIALIGLLWLLRAYQQQKQVIKNEPTWGCGYKGTKSTLFQYTATSYASSYANLSSKLVNVDKKFKEYDDLEIFPKPREFETSFSDVFENNLITKPSNKLLYWLKKMAIFQTGKIQHYLLYAIVFLFVIMLLTLFNLI